MAGRVNFRTIWAPTASVGCKYTSQPVRRIELVGGIDTAASALLVSAAVSARSGTGASVSPQRPAFKEQQRRRRHFSLPGKALGV